MLIGPVRYILVTERLQGHVFTALPGCRATALPLKREVAPTLVIVGLNIALKGPFPLVGESELSRNL
jgi:hypothetical protein